MVKINKVNHIKFLKNFPWPKTSRSKMEKCGKYLQYIIDKSLRSLKYKELLKLKETKRPTTLKMGKRYEQTVHKERNAKDIGHRKICPNSLIINKC